MIIDGYHKTPKCELTMLIKDYFNKKLGRMDNAANNYMAV